MSEENKSTPFYKSGVFWTIIGIIAVLILIPVTSYISAVNLGNRQEKLLQAALDHNKQTFSNATDLVLEIAQVPAQMVKDKKDLITAQLNARYGTDGSKAMFQVLKEQNIDVDASQYQKIQQVMESRRRDFSEAQDELIDKKRIYETQLGSFWTGLWLRIAGYPKIDLKEIKVLVDAGVVEDYKSGTTKVLKLGQ